MTDSAATIINYVERKVDAAADATSATVTVGLTAGGSYTCTAVVATNEVGDSGMSVRDR